MNEFILSSYEIDNRFPTLTVSSFEPNYLMDINNYIESDANDIPAPSLLVPSSDDEPIQPRLASEIGRCGECIAKKYLETIFNEIKDFTKKYTLGYDLQADEFQIEVKTTIKEINCFEISINELNKMDQNKEASYLFFIKIKKDSVFGWLILNPIDQFAFTLEALKCIFTNDNISVDATKVRIIMSETFLKSHDKIDLSAFLPEDGEEGYEEWISLQKRTKQD